MNAIRFLLLTSAVLISSVAFYAFRATGQDDVLVPQPEPTYQRVLAPRTVVEVVDGKPVQRTVVEEQVRQLPPRSSLNLGNPLSAANAAQSALHADPEVAKMYHSEQEAANEAATLAAEIRKPGGDTDENREQLREKLSTIFDLQQQRRAHEVAKIEARLASLKDVMKKRESAKDSIVDRRLQVLTGGVDELGWEETQRTLPAPTATPGYSLPGTVPYNPYDPTFPSTTPVPTPRAGTNPSQNVPTISPPPAVAR